MEHAPRAKHSEKRNLEPIPPTAEVSFNPLVVHSNPFPRGKRLTPSACRPPDIFQDTIFVPPLFYAMELEV